MKMRLYLLMVPALCLSTAAFAGEGDAKDNERKQTRVEYEALLEEAEHARVEAEAVRHEAMKMAEMARQVARSEATLAREQAQLSREEQAELTRHRALQEKEIQKAREELSKAHRELREATRQVARAHRDLARDSTTIQQIRVVNLGDRAVIGLVMGEESEEGIDIIAVSPDGPAEQAGLKPGDTLISIRGEDLSGDEEASSVVYRVMSDVEDGEELAVAVLRDGEQWDFTVTAETREPSAWQSLVRLPEIEVIEGSPGEQRIIVEHIEIPEIDHVQLESQIAEIAERLKHKEFIYATEHDRDFSFSGDFEFEAGEFSDLAGHAMREANVWFGLPHSQGLELATINEGLGEYFKTDRGVLVVRAKEDNAYQLESGDVILQVGSTPVDSPADMMRALREIEPGSDIDLEIKRNRRDKTLSVVMPENRLGYRTSLHH